MAEKGYNKDTGFRFVNTLSIDSATFNKWDSSPDSTSSVSPSPDSTVKIIKATKTLDSVHDELGKEAIKAKPNDWEDKMIEYTQVGTSPVESAPLIPDALNTYAKCVVVQRNSRDEGKVPYTIPNNNEVCYIKDCFMGQCVPGLNNLLDQAGASLDNFLKENTTSLKSPLKGDGGLGQQLMKINPGDKRLEYTAYFNYDLLMFRYIFDNYTPSNKRSGSQTLDNLYKKVNINEPTNEYTSNEIQLINTVNLNYLWAYLMIFCKESVEEDIYLKNMQQVQLEYITMLKQLSQIRFDGFMVKGNFITNPIFYYRGIYIKDKYNIIDKNIATFIDNFCNNVYNNMKQTNMLQQTNMFQQQPNNSNLAGNVQYTTTQSMAAKAICSFLGKIKSVVCRNANSKNPEQNACMKEITQLLNNGITTTANKKHAASGWSILKFSGDTSHVVFGEIMEWVKNYYGKPFEIVYLLSERPLAGRLLSVGKTIMMKSTNVFMKSFTGKGSENKDNHYAAFYISFDKSISYRNIIDGLINKVSKVFNNQGIYNRAFNNDYRKMVFTTDPTTLDTFLKKAEYLSPKFEGNPTSDNITDEKLLELNTYITNPEVVKFLQAYEIDELTNKLDKIPNEFTIVGETLIGKRLLGVRINSTSNWTLLINELYKRERDINYTNDFLKQYDNIRKIMSISNLLIDKIDIDPNLENILNNKFIEYKNNAGFLAIFNKMVNKFSDSLKLNRFEDERIADWLNNKKGTSQKIPGSIELIIQDLKLFIDDCLRINNGLTEAKINITGGSGSSKRGRGYVQDPMEVDPDSDIVEGNIEDSSSKKQRTGTVQYTETEAIEDSKEFIEEFENTLKQSMIAYNNDNNDETIDYTEFQEMVDTYVLWRGNNYPEFENISVQTIVNNANIYNVLADRFLLLSGLVTENSELEETVKEHFDFIIQSYKIARFEENTLPSTDSEQSFNVILSQIQPIIETELQTTTVINNITQLTNNLNNKRIKGIFKEKLNELYPSFSDDFDDWLNTLKGEFNSPVTSIIFANNNLQQNLTNLMNYIQTYNIIVSKHQLLQPYIDSDRDIRTTILGRLVQLSSNIQARGGKKTKKRRKISRKKKGHKKTKKRRTIKKNRKN